MDQGLERRSAVWIWGVSILVSGAALAWVLSQLDLSDLARVLTNVKPGFMTLALAALVTETVLASVRLRVLLAPRPAAGFADCVKMTSLHGVYLVLLPARIGELAYLLLLNRIARQRLGAAVGNLVYQRLSDTVVLAVLFLSTVLLAFMEHARSIVLWFIIAGGSAAVLACWLSLPRLLTMVSVICLQWFGRRARLARTVVLLALQASRWSRRIMRIQVRLSVLALTFGAWLAAAATVVCLFHAFNAALDWEQMVLAGIAVQVIGAIPVYTVGGLGVAEAGLAGVLMAFDVETARAVTLALAVRLALVLGQVAVLALVFPVAAAAGHLAPASGARPGT